MKSLFFRRRSGRVSADRPAFGFFVAGALAVLAAVFVIGLQTGRYIERSRPAAERPAEGARAAADNQAAAIGKELGAFAEEAEKVKAVSPPRVEGGAASVEKDLTFREALEGKAPAPAVLAPAPAKEPKGGAEARKGGRGAKAFSVQAGAFREEGKAKAAMSRLAKAGFPAVVKKTPGKEGRLYRVVVGPYGTKDAALRTMRRIRSEMKLDAVLVKG